jgi:hypothetical protein
LPQHALAVGVVVRDRRDDRDGAPAVREDDFLTGADRLDGPRELLVGRPQPMRWHYLTTFTFRLTND